MYWRSWTLGFSTGFGTGTLGTSTLGTSAVGTRVGTGAVKTGVSIRVDTIGVMGAVEVTVEVVTAEAIVKDVGGRGAFVHAGLVEVLSDFKIGQASDRVYMRSSA